MEGSESGKSSSGASDRWIAGQGVVNASASSRVTTVVGTFIASRSRDPWPLRLRPLTFISPARVHGQAIAASPLSSLFGHEARRVHQLERVTRTLERPVACDQF